MSSKYRKVIDPKTGATMFVKKRTKVKRNPDIDKPRAVIQAINKGKPLDRRTKAGRQIAEIRDEVSKDLDGAARALLLDDVAQAAVIQRACIKAAYKEPDEMIGPNGEPCQAIHFWGKYAGIKKSALLALKRFEKKEPNPKQPEAGDLGDMVLEVSANEPRADGEDSED